MLRRVILALGLLVAASLPTLATEADLYCLNPNQTSGQDRFVPCGSTVPLQNAQPTGTTTQAKVAVAVTNTYQQALPSSATRKGCTIQYIAVAGTKGFVFFGAAPGDTTTSFQITSGQAISCDAPGITLTDAVQVTGTATDIFVVSNQ